MTLNEIALSVLGVSAIPLSAWAVLARTRKNVAADNGTRDGISSILQLSGENSKARNEADMRTKLAQDALQQCQERELVLERRITTLSGQVESLQEDGRRMRKDAADMRTLVSELATLLVKSNPEARPFVERWIQDSGYPPLDRVK